MQAKRKKKEKPDNFRWNKTLQRLDDPFIDEEKPIKIKPHNPSNYKCPTCQDLGHPNGNPNEYCVCVFGKKLLAEEIKPPRRQEPDYLQSATDAILKLPPVELTVTVPLSKGYSAIIDASDKDLILRHKWYISAYGYAVRNYLRKDGKKRLMPMHREIINAPKGMVVDHINHNRLDNRKSNLRVVSNQENMQNQLNPERNVAFHKYTGKYRVELTVNYKRVWIGLFKTKEEAVEAAKTARAVHYPGSQEALKDSPKSADNYHVALAALESVERLCLSGLSGVHSVRYLRSVLASIRDGQFPHKLNPYTAPILEALGENNGTEQNLPSANRGSSVQVDRTKKRKKTSRK